MKYRISDILLLVNNYSKYQFYIQNNFELEQIVNYVYENYDYFNSLPNSSRVLYMENYKYWHLNLVMIASK